MVGLRSGITIVFAVLFVGALCFAAVQNRRYKKLQERQEKELAEMKTAKLWVQIQDAMLPTKLIQLFQQGDLEKIRIGEERNIRAAMLSFNVPGFSRLIRSRTPEEIFAFVNRTLTSVVPCVLYQEGEIDKYIDAGLTAFYLEDPERALRTAVSICEAMNRPDRGEETVYSMGLSYGDVMIGMVGHEKRIGVLTISETTGVADFLQELAGRYQARILLTGSLRNQIPEFERRYNSRYLGRIYLRAANVTEELYDVFDGDAPADKNGKRKTRLLFEKGVEMFQKGQYQDARLHFIEVLKASRMDGAAREYLHLCNQYLERNDERENFPYLAVYE